jgi:LAS superfamily LD-carboxypeptidase LdcB
MTKPRARLALLVGAVALVAAACVPAAPPAPPPVSNGRLPDSALTTFSPSCRVANELTVAFHAMLVAANTQGVALAPERSSYLPPGAPQPPELTSCYRSYDMQVWWRNYYCSIGQCNLAAPPGTSKHGWGKAVDLEDQLGQLTFSSPGYQWLYANAAAYGFYQPVSATPFGSSPEPWHWVHD